MVTPISNQDVLVVGAGIAGMTAAIRAAELGLKVRVLEQGDGDHYLCNSRFTGGLFHIGMDDMGSEPQTIFDRVMKVTAGQSRPELAKTLAANADRTIDWLAGQGVRLVRVGPDGLRRNSLTPPGVRKTGLNWKWRAGDVMLRTLNARLAALGGALDKGVCVAEVLHESGQVHGLSAQHEGQSVQYLAPVVILCDGGFQANADLMRRFVSSKPERLLMRNAETGRGTGLQMAEAVGAKLVGMESFYGHVQYRDAMTDTSFWPYPVLDSLCVSGLLIDADGQRFCDESLGGVHIANKMARLENPLGCHVVFDDKIWQGPGRDWLLPANPFLEHAGGRLLTASTLAELALLVGVLPDTLISSCSRWNSAVAGTGNFDPERTKPLIRPHPIETGPFHAIPLCAGVTYTMGGILTDAAAQVLDHDENPIAGLLAAGACTGGLEGFETSGYSGGLSKSSVFGLIAGETAATVVRARMKEAS